MSPTSSLWVRHAALVFALKTFGAAMLAFSIALLLGMPRPFWAMTTVFITANPLSGATSSKAVYRIIGTLIGAAGTLVLIPNLVNAPELLSFAIALWLGTFVYFSLIDGTPRSYVFVLAGYSIPLLGFPILTAPELTFDVVVSRVQEILIGIIVASAVSTLVLPQKVASAVMAQTDAWLAGARKLAVDILTGRGSDQERDGERLRLGAAAAGLDELHRHLDYEAAASATTVRGLKRLRRHMLALLPLLAAVEDRASQAGASKKLTEVRARIARWLEAGAQDKQEADSLRTALHDVQPALRADAGWSELSVAGLVTRLRHLVDVMQDCLSLREAIADGRDPDKLSFGFTPETFEAAVPHRDHRLALWSAAAVALSVLACCAFWIATGWADGAQAALIAAVVGSIFAGVDDPLSAFRSLNKLILICIVVSGVYIFGVLPRVTTIETLIAALMPTFVLFGWMAARPATARTGYLLGLFTSVQLALQSSYSADFPSFTEGSIALVLGIEFAGVTFAIVRLLGARSLAGRLLRSNWRTLAAVAVAKAPQGRAAVASLMQHRLALLAARIAAVPAEAKSDTARLRQLRAALSIIDLRRAGLKLSHHTQSQIDVLLGSLGSAFAAYTTGPLPGELIRRLDDTIASTLQQPPNVARNEALLALTSIRSGLFPAAPGYEPHDAEPRRMAA